MKDDKVHLLHILEGIRRIEENADAVLRSLQTMAESTQLSCWIFHVF